MAKTALVAGGTGLVGEILVSYLIENKGYSEVKILVRKGSGYALHGASSIEVEYDRLSDYSDELKADVVFCCLGTTMKKAGSKAQFYTVDFTYVFELAKIAETNKIAQFNIISASGANSTSSFFYNKVKGETEEAISRLDFASINIFRPSLLLGVRYEPRMGEQIGAVLAKIIRPVMIGKLKKYRAIRAERVAGAMLNISLENNQGVRIIESDAIHDYGRKFLRERIFSLQQRKLKRL